MIHYFINNYDLTAFNVPSIKFSAENKMEGKLNRNAQVCKAVGVERAPQS